jgi:hypothetical protein
MTKPKTKRRIFTDEFKAAAIATLAAESGNLKKTARIVGVSPSTLRGWRSAPYVVPPEVQEAATGSLDSILQGIATKLFTGLNKPEAIARLLGKPAQAAVVGGIVVDKIVNLRRSTTDESKLTLSEFLSMAKWVEEGDDKGPSRAQIVPSLEASSAPERPN